MNWGQVGSTSALFRGRDVIRHHARLKGQSDPDETVIAHVKTTK